MSSRARLWARCWGIWDRGDQGQNPGLGPTGSECRFGDAALEYRNKQSITRDRKTPERQNLVRQFVAQLDAIVEHYSLGTMECWDLDLMTCVAYTPTSSQGAGGTSFTYRETAMSGAVWRNPRGARWPQQALHDTGRCAHPVRSTKGLARVPNQ